MVLFETSRIVPDALLARKDRQCFGKDGASALDRSMDGSLQEDKEERKSIDSQMLKKHSLQSNALREWMSKLEMILH